MLKQIKCLDSDTNVGQFTGNEGLLYGTIWVRTLTLPSVVVRHTAGPQTDRSAYRFSGIVHGNEHVAV
jgi:hypothetical protein